MDNLYLFKDTWAQLAANLLLQVPTGGLIGLVDEENQHQWIREITKALEQRGVELPTTEIHRSVDEVWGVALSEYPRNHPVTIFTPVNTLGGELDFTVRWLARQGIGVNRTIALIDRGGFSPMSQTPDERVPFSAVLHLPLPLYSPEDEVMFTELEFVAPTLRRWRDIHRFAYPLVS